MVSYCLRQLLMDALTLDDYENFRNVSWVDIKQRLMLNERKINPLITDNHLWASLDYYQIDNLKELLTQGLVKLSEEYLEPIDTRVYVCKERFALWQELLTFCPPLILIASYSSSHKEVDISYIKHSALLPPYIEELEEMKVNYSGFNDLHIHLNGSTETDILWQDALSYSNEFKNNYRRALKKENYVKEQSEQENVFRDSDHLFNLLTSAKALRYYCVNKFLIGRDLPYPDSEKRRNEYSQYQEREIHPLKSNDTKELSDLNLECLMFIRIINKLKDEKISDEDISKLLKAFHHYLLILGSINRFVVQQVHQKGFQQFQKLTVNGFRSFSEAEYEKRFFQLNGNGLGSNFKILEGRFAPKETTKDNDDLIAKIRKGWYSFKDIKKDGHHEIRLVCHFIKKSTSECDTYRHEKFRRDLWIQANVIKLLKGDKDWLQYPEEDKCKCFQKLVAIDAAASEFDASPEVFSPSFRFLRRQESNGKECFKNITFHAGEDYFHIVSGLRAIHEAISFLDMKEGDRIGHGTALGVSPQLWRERMGDEIYISIGEWMDNLIFCLYILELQPCALYTRIEDEARRLFRSIYPCEFDFTMEDLIAAWELRKWDPEIIFASSFSEIDPLKSKEWSEILELNPSEQEKKILRHYLYNSREYNKKILVNFEIINDDVIIQLQQKILLNISNKSIILETLPTSNVRIGIYKNHEEHHLKTWINEDIITQKPQIVVGCDDAGIFATNIYNEYAHIYIMYLKNQGLIVEKLINHSDTFVFSN